MGVARTTRRVARSAGLLFALAGGVGCSADERQNVSGRVTLNGEPLPTGIVQFVGPGDRLSTAIVRDGAFVATDLVPGEVRVAVVEDAPPGAAGRSPMPGAGQVPKGVVLPKRIPIPARYKLIDTSGLRYTVVPHGPPMDIRLE